MAKVSIIIAVYNTAKYIRRCARSLFEQTLEDIEYIFVNDCTPDRSIDILKDVIKDYPERVSQIKIIDMPQNSGQAAVRRCGIGEASGEYVIHCDSDDWVDRDMYRQMYDKAKADNLDMVICGFNEVWEDSEKKVSNIESGSDDITRSILSSQWGGVLWNKMVKREIVQDIGIVHPKGDHWEDLALTVQYSLRCHSVGFIEKPLYYYLHRGSSALGMSGSTVDKFIENTVAAADNYDIIVSCLRKAGVGDKYAGITLRRQLYLKNQFLKAPHIKGFTRLYRMTCESANNRVLLSKFITAKEKFNFIIAMSGLYPSLISLKKFC